MQQSLGFVQQQISACGQLISNLLAFIGAALFSLLLGLWASLAGRAIA